MVAIRLTKNELRSQQTRLKQLIKYLPTLQLKKAMLQLEVNEARQEILQAEKFYNGVHDEVSGYSGLLVDRASLDPALAAKVKEVKKRYENIAGIDVPYFDGITFEPYEYDLFDTPPWVDGVIVGLRQLTEASIRIKVAQEKKEALERELREVSIRVNLFEKILIPRARDNIKKIKVFLGDQELASVSRAKVAKGKIEAAKVLSIAAVRERAHAR